MDDSDFKKIRTGLMAISVAIIIYIVGGGDIKGGSFLGGAIVFKRAWVLELTAILLWIYQNYRYWLYSKNTYYEWKCNFFDTIFTHKKYLELADKHEKIIDEKREQHDEKLRETKQQKKREMRQLFGTSAAAMLSASDNFTLDHRAPINLNRNGPFESNLNVFSVTNPKDNTIYRIPLVFYPLYNPTLFIHKTEPFGDISNEKSKEILSTREHTYIYYEHRGNIYNDLKITVDIDNSKLDNKDRNTLNQIVVTALFKSSISRKAFSDLIIPWILSGLALISLLLRPIIDLLS